MTTNRRHLGWGLLAIVLLGSGGTSDSSLRVCFEARSAPFSAASGLRHGLDYDVAALVAESLDRSLSVHWFEASEEEEFPIPLQANALLSRGLCDLVGGYPLLTDSLGDPATAEYRFVEGDGSWGHIRLNRLLASRPYLSLPLTLISAEERTDIDRLDDIAGLRLAVERETLASAIAMVYGGARLQGGISRVSFEDDAIFKALETRDADIALVELHRFELYRGHFPDTRLRETGYRHGLAVNTGFTGIDPLLLAEVDIAIQALGASDRIAEISEAYGLSYSSPVDPAIFPPITPRLLARRQPHL
jgi:ABC-type amino acid transport substrate-binding protein